MPLAAALPECRLEPGRDGALALAHPDRGKHPGQRVLGQADGAFDGGHLIGILDHPELLDDTAHRDRLDLS